MATTNVTNLDIQLLDADRSNATTIKLDNPKDNITREQVSAAMQTPLANGWFLTNSGAVATYLGNVIINQSIKTTLDGEDFYVTPTTLAFTLNTSYEATQTVTVSGATIQGYSFDNIQSNAAITITATIAENGLTINITVKGSMAGIQGTFDTKLVIMGTIITIPCTVQAG